MKQIYQAPGQQDSKADGKEKIATPPITGLAHAESYESLYEILHKWQSDSNNWNAADGARGIELYSSDAETDMVSESTADAGCHGRLLRGNVSV